MIIDRKYMELFKNCKIFAPEALSETQVLTAAGKILAIGDKLSVRGCDVKVIDLKGRCLCPGFIDQHVHVTGGGGQFGFASFMSGIRAFISEAKAVPPSESLV